MLETTLLVIGVVLVGIYLLIRPRKGDANAPPCVTSSPVVPVPILGMALEFGLSPVKTITRCFHEFGVNTLFHEFGGVFTIPFLHKRMTVLVGPEAQSVFFRASDDVMSQNEVYDFMRPIFGEGVVYDATKKNRQTQFQSMANGLRVSRLKAYVSKVEMETRQYLKQWGDSGEVDLLNALSELTILTASRCLHGNDVREQMFVEISELYHDLDQGLTPLTVFWPNAPTKAHRKRNAARQKMVQLFQRVIEERRQNPEKTDGTDILQIFMDMTYKDGSKSSVDQVTGLLIALLFAGQHTSCITSTWTSLFIANNGGIVEKVMEEQNKVFSSSSSSDEVTFDKLNEMPYLHNCMREALRLCPPLILLIRKAMVDVPIAVDGKKYVIPKGDMVAVSPSVGMRIKSVFPDPDEFDPDRYMEPREEHKIPYAWMGFGGGMHSCMGQNFAFVQVKTILSVLFREYEIKRIAPNMPEIDYEAMVVGPKGDCRVHYKKRVLV
eukprot:CAMPEP_0116575070 /NCGR_PEP_ID=MMETSP0397-20121206/19749_1 /TAXON_ID=216820 /ORGANISM="Cyclophora tenuis, Strain ECT3854" /LENGTH=493 /DNA_ID=CAMNT_0004103913 /DNA_START=1 /DNA_END=1483 /DNA_ORIENTATION=-